ncbi:MAG: TetR/AcrR family transcriptional regulator [Alteraurantiacibacter sp.]
MGRRSDHTAKELRALLVGQGHGLLAESGFAKFSAREAARRAGYSVGTIYNVFGSLDGYLIAINSRTFLHWAAALDAALDGIPPEGAARLEALVLAYFAFAEENRNLWMAIYDHRIDREIDISAGDIAAREALTGIVDREVGDWFGAGADPNHVRRLVRSLIATVHGHCALWLSGSYALMQESEPARQALARVLEVLAANRAP